MRMPTDLITDTRGALLTNREKVQLVWPLFIPPAGTVAMTITCIILANRIGTRRAAAMAAAFTVSEKAFGEYRDKVVEKMGVNKEQAARDEIAQERVTADPASSREVIITGNGDVLCYDLYSGRYFKSGMEDIKQAVNRLNHMVNNQSYASLNDFYDHLGLDRIKMGEEVGWTTDELLEPVFGTTISDDNKPCITLDFRVSPVRNYWRTHH